MKTVNTAELKNRLSLYLNQVKAGEEIVVRRGDKLIARIVPIVPADDEHGDLGALAATGKIRLCDGVIDDSFWRLPAPRVSPEALRRAVNRSR
jgi:antitoxin (DNA-binding transcriptional repressor) of toxin-antitoxin stability system